MSFFPKPNMFPAPCLACSGTGIRGGGLSGKKKCKTCKGTKIRWVEDIPLNKSRTVLDGWNRGPIE